MKGTVNERLEVFANYAVCVTLLPFMIMAYQYQRNIQYLSLWHVIIFCVFASGVLLAVYFISKKYTKSSLGAFIFTGFLFFAFFMYNVITKPFDKLYALLRFTDLARVLSYVLAAFVIAFIIAYFCRKHKEKLNTKIVGYIAFVMIVTIILQNIAGIVLYASKQQSSDEFYKDTFNVELSNENQPNIYWFHCDGMLGFDAMSRFFGDEQEEFARELNDRGFWINREASFEAMHKTQWALPTLMSPYYYDSVLSWKLDPLYAESVPENKELLNDPSLRLEPNVLSNRVAREKNETVMAFNAAGYNTSTISRIDIYFYPTVRQFYNGSSLMTTTQSVEETMEYVNRASSAGNLLDLMRTISALPSPIYRRARDLFNKLITNGFETVDVAKKVDLFSELNVDETSRAQLNSYNSSADCLTDVLERPSPKFTIFDFLMPHTPFCYDEAGNYNKEGAFDPARYPAHHTFSADTLLKYMDIILETDPDAVIVLQADHGLHGLYMEEITSAFNCTDEEALAMWNQVMCAVRLPEDKMTQETLEILSDPRNISRYLINNYIGDNYDYISGQFRQVYTGPGRP